RRKVGPFDVGEQLGDADGGIVDGGADAIDDFPEVVRGDVRRHADGDAGAAVDEQVGNGGGQDGGLLVGLVVVGDEIDGVLLQVGHQGRTAVGEAGLGVPHRGGRVAFDGAEVALPIDEDVAHGPMLG